MILYTSDNPPVAPSLANNFNHGTAGSPPSPFAASAGAGALAFFAVGKTPKAPAALLRSKTGVVRLEKKWWPLIARLEGVSVDGAAGSTNCSATAGRERRRSG